MHAAQSALRGLLAHASPRSMDRSLPHTCPCVLSLVIMNVCARGCVCVGCVSSRRRRSTLCILRSEPSLDFLGLTTPSLFPPSPPPLLPLFLFLLHASVPQDLSRLKGRCALLSLSLPPGSACLLAVLLLNSFPSYVPCPCLSSLGTVIRNASGLW